MVKSFLIKAISIADASISIRNETIAKHEKVKITDIGVECDEPSVSYRLG